MMALKIAGPHNVVRTFLKSKIYINLNQVVPSSTAATVAVKGLPVFNPARNLLRTTTSIQRQRHRVSRCAAVYSMVRGSKECQTANCRSAHAQ